MIQPSQKHWTPRNETQWQNPRSLQRDVPLGLLLHAARMSSAAFARNVWPRGRKVRGVSSQRMTNLRDDGGVIGDVAALMVCDPRHAHEVIEHLRSFLPRPSHRPLVELICIKRKSDSADDVAETELLADMTPEKLAEYRDALRAAIADARELLDAVEHELQERSS